MPRLDVLLCTRNRPDRALAVVRDVLAQEPSVGHVIVVDQSDDPRPLRNALADQPVEWLHCAPLGLPRARNVALDRARSDLVLYLDDDVRLLPGCLAAHIAAYEDRGVGAAVGRVIERHAVGNARRTANRIGWHGRVVTQLAGVRAMDVQVTKGCHMSYRREALVRAGGFDVRLGGTALLEDAEASARVADLGWRVRFIPDAEVVHLSDPVGGVRQDSALRTQACRFRNSALYLSSRRGPLGVMAAAPVFTAIALRDAARSASPARATHLARAFLRGISDAKNPRDGYLPGDATRYGRTS